MHHHYDLFIKIDVCRMCQCVKQQNKNKITNFSVALFFYLGKLLQKQSVSKSNFEIKETFFFRLSFPFSAKLFQNLVTSFRLGDAFTICLFVCLFVCLFSRHKIFKIDVDKCIRQDSMKFVCTLAHRCTRVEKPVERVPKILKILKVNYSVFYCI
jgi:hypothetical protein